jgi:hypothetical protein
MRYASKAVYLVTKCTVRRNYVHCRVLDFFQFHVTVHHTMINENTSLMQQLSIYFT